LSDSVLGRRGRPRIVILDERFDVVMADAQTEGSIEIFRPIARRIVDKDLESEEIDVAGRRYIVRVTRLTGSEGHRYALLIEVRGTRRPLVDAYDRFGLSGREAEVLALIIDGASNREIAETLCITESTVQDHVRSVCAKAGVRGRGALLARVFDVRGEAGAAGQSPPE
jgi:DNA-binding CsgD family transcriptional regulator